MSHVRMSFDETTMSAISDRASLRNIIIREEICTTKCNSNPSYGNRLPTKTTYCQTIAS